MTTTHPTSTILNKTELSEGSLAKILH